MICIWVILSFPAGGLFYVLISAVVLVVVAWTVARA
jgi:hypothetical protein